MSRVLLVGQFVLLHLQHPQSTPSSLTWVTVNLQKEQAFCRVPKPFRLNLTNAFEAVVDDVKSLKVDDGVRVSEKFLTKWTMALWTVGYYDESNTLNGHFIR